MSLKKDARLNWLMEICFSINGLRRPPGGTQSREDLEQKQSLTADRVSVARISIHNWQFDLLDTIHEMSSC